MKNKIVKLTESDLHRIVEESVNKIINEDNALLNNVTSVSGANYEYLAKKMYATLQNDEIFKSFINAILHFYQKGDTNRLTTIGQKLITNLSGIARYYAQYNNRNNQQTAN